METIENWAASCAQTIKALTGPYGDVIFIAIAVLALVTYSIKIAKKYRF